MRTGHDAGEILPVMPWNVHGKMTRLDLRAIHEYLGDDERRENAFNFTGAASRRQLHSGNSLNGRLQQAGRTAPANESDFYWPNWAGSRGFALPRVTWVQRVFDMGRVAPFC